MEKVLYGLWYMRLRAGGMLFISMVYCMSAHGNYYMLFDDPYPSTPFKTALRTTARAWQLCHILHGDGARSSEYDLIEDALLGCMTRLTSEIRMIVDNGSTVLYEDMFYLQRLFDDIKCISDELIANKAVDVVVKEHIDKVYVILGEIIYGSIEHIET